MSATRTPTAARVAERIALTAAIAPAAVMAVRAAATSWVPLFDAAYFTVRSRDVATGHHPLVGAWSMGSRGLGTWVNNLGPLQLDALAPFTKLDPYWGTAAGVAATNVASIVGVWLVSRRIAGPLGAIGAMAATVLLQLNEGALMLIEARQQLALVLPMWCTLWLAAATWMDRRWALPWLALAASFVLQTHLTYAFPAAFVAVAATVAFAVHATRRTARAGAPGVRSPVRPLLLAAAVTAACWVQPVWDQLRGTGNLVRVLGEGGGVDGSVGASRGLPILAESAFLPPFLLPGSMGDLLREGARPSLPAAVAAVSGWVTATAIVAVVMRGRQPVLAAMASVGVVALGASVLAVIQIPPTEQFGIIAQNYYWIWPVATFVATAVVGSVLWAAVRWRRGSVIVARLEAGLPVGAAALTALAAIPLLRPGTNLPETEHEWAASRHLARPLLDELGASLDELDIDGPVLIDLGAVRHVRYTLLAELQRRGIEFVFAAGSTDLSRFGQRRCDDGSASMLLTLSGGPGALQLRSSGLLLAAVPGLSEEQAARSTRLADRFGEALRSGAVTVDGEAVAALGGTVPAGLAQVSETPGMPARRLSGFLDDWSHLGAVDITGELAAELVEWRELERAAVEDRMAVHLRPIPSGRPDRCDELEPGPAAMPPR